MITEKSSVVKDVWVMSQTYLRTCDSGTFVSCRSMRAARIFCAAGESAGPRFTAKLTPLRAGFEFKRVVLAGADAQEFKHFIQRCLVQIHLGDDDAVQLVPDGNLVGSESVRTGIRQGGFEFQSGNLQFPLAVDLGKQLGPGMVVGGFLVSAFCG